MFALRYLLLTALFFSCAHHSAPTAALDQIVIVGTNDFHGYLKPVEVDILGNKVILGGAAWFGGYAKILQKKYGNRLVLLDGGDLFQGTMESNTFLGKSVVDYYNLLPYRAATIGNHEFDYGPRKKGDPDRLGALRDRIKQAKFAFVSANIFEKKSGMLWREKNLFPSVMVKAGPYNLGVIGLTTTSTLRKTLPQNIQGLEFRDFLEPTLEQSKLLRAQGADVVVILTHEGGEKPGGPLYELLKALPPGTIDAVVSGHDHSSIAEFVLGVPVIQSKTRGNFFGRIDLFLDPATKKIVRDKTVIHPMHWICGTWFKNAESCDPKDAGERLDAKTLSADQLFPLRAPSYEGEPVVADQRVEKVLQPYFAKTEGTKKEILGQAKENFQWEPSGENQVGDLFIQAFRKKFTYARAIYLNGGGIRRRLYKGPITYGDIYEVHPFDNFAVAVKLSGAQFKDLLRVGVSGANTLPLLWGVKVKFHEDEKPEYLRDLNGDGKKENWERNRLAEVVWESSGKPVRDDEEFWVATNDYLASGGDKTSHVFDSIQEKNKRFLDITSRDLVADYLRKNPGLSLPNQVEVRLEKVR